MTGAILAPRYVYIEPSLAFAPMLSFQVVIMALLGGAGRLWGPLVGVIPFTLLWEADLVQLPATRPRCCWASPFWSSSTCCRAALSACWNSCAHRAAGKTAEGLA